MHIEIDTAAETIKVGDATIRMDVLCCLAQPNPKVMYRFCKDEFGIVTVTTFPVIGMDAYAHGAPN